MFSQSKLPLRFFLILSVCLSLGVSCAKDDDDDDEGVDTTSGLPKVNSINFDGLGEEEAGLIDGDCTQSETLGVFGLALGGVCNSAPLAESIMLGTTTIDDDFTCADDYDENASGTGIIVHLLCNAGIEDRTESFAFEDDEEGGFLAVSFASFGSGNAVGQWFPNGANSYPANIRLFAGDELNEASLEGIYSFELTDINTGTIQVDVDEGDDLDFPLAVVVNFQNQTGNTDDCEDEPSKETCHWQEVSLYAGDGVPTGPPNGFHLIAYVDDKEEPTFVAGQGLYTYSAEAAASLASDSSLSSLADLRKVQFEFVQKGSQIWGRFDFQDAAGETLSGASGAFDLLADADGLCHNLGEDEATLCIDIDPDDYTDLWSSDFESIESSPVDEDVFDDDVPTELGVQTAD